MIQSKEKYYPSEWQRGAGGSSGPLTIGKLKLLYWAMKYQVSVVPTQSLSFPKVKEHTSLENYVVIKMCCYFQDVRKWPFNETSAEKHCLINVKIISKLPFFKSI